MCTAWKETQITTPLLEPLKYLFSYQTICGSTNKEFHDPTSSLILSWSWNTLKIHVFPVFVRTEACITQMLRTLLVCANFRSDFNTSSSQQQPNGISHLAATFVHHWASHAFPGRFPHPSAHPPSWVDALSRLSPVFTPRLYVSPAPSVSLTGERAFEMKRRLPACRTIVGWGQDAHRISSPVYKPLVLSYRRTFQ